MECPPLLGHCRSEMCTPTSSQQSAGGSGCGMLMQPSYQRHLHRFGKCVGLLPHHDMWFIIIITIVVTFTGIRHLFVPNSHT
jgi:hypothetical protein